MSTPVSSTSSFASSVASTFSPITMSGFNNIDFNAIINALMQQASVPLTGLQTQQTNLQAQNGNYTTLASDLGAVQTAASSLAAVGSLTGTTVSSTNANAASLSTSATTPQGSYSVVVKTLAQAQVTSSTSTYADSNTTTVASGGSLTIGSATVTLTGNTTLQGLADAINATTGTPATASVVQSSPGQYSLVLTGNQTGSANAFTITNNLTGGAGITFGGNAQTATDATATVNGLAIDSSTNNIGSVIPGSTLTLLQADPNTTITLTVTQDTSNAKSLVQSFVTAYNNLETFAQSQEQAYLNGDPTSIANDGLLRGLMINLSSMLGGPGGTDPTYQYLAQVGIGFDTSGNLTFNSGAFDSAAAATSLNDIQNLFSGPDGSSGVFSSVNNMVTSYVGSGGLVANQQTQISNELSMLGQQIIDMQNQLALQQQSLQQEYAAADTTISTLNNEAGSLTGLTNQYQLN
ncbi:MAG TPA: flagellar filament capping protein FliD [Vicinamibacterales bacterium]|nr:flagellar filament capping protein FliD [Vicinamibacterales bacterium]